MTRQRERGPQRPDAQRTSAPPTPQPPEYDATLRLGSPGAPLDQQPTARYDATLLDASASGDGAANDLMTTEALPALDEPMTLPPSTSRTLASITTRHRSGVRAANAGALGDATQQSQALIPLKMGKERKRALAAINRANGGANTLIPGARRYRPPTATVVPRRPGPRSAVMQFAVAMIVTAMLISALTLSTPLGQAAALNGINGPVRAYANAAPWIPTPTPTPKPTATPLPYRPPAGANPGQQAVIAEIESVFGGYSQSALAIANCESGYDPNAWNGYAILNSHASGVFQILYPSTWDTTSYAGSSPFNADANIHAAYEIFQRDGYSWREWQCQP